MAIPRPSVSVDAIVLGFHKPSPGVILDLGGPDKVKTIDSGRTTENFSTRPIKGAVVGTGLGKGVEPPVVGRVQQGICESVTGNDWEKKKV